MRGNRYKFEKICRAVLLLIVGAFLLSAKPLQAAEITGSIRVEYQGKTKDDEKIMLSDTPFTLYEVGAMKDGKWRLNEIFAKSGISLEGTTASERKAQAEKLYAYVRKNQLSGVIQKTDKNGVAVFTNLNNRVYLIIQTEKKTTAQAGSFNSEPFLVSIPSEVNGEILYDVRVEVKSEWEDGMLQDDPDEENKPKPSDVKTGDTTTIVGYVILMLLCSMGVTVLLLKLRNKNKLDEKK